MRRLLLLVPSLLLAAASGRAEIIERIVVKVNGDIVTLTEFQTRQLRALQQARVTPEKVSTFLRENNANLLQDAIDELVLKQRAEEQGLRIPPQYITDTIEEIKRDNNIDSDEKFLEVLDREGMTLEDLKRDIELPMLRRGVLQRDLEAKVSATDADVRAEYEKNKDKYSRPATVTLQEILIKGDAAQAQAKALAERIRQGEDFAALAREHSSAATKAQGGDLGKIARGELSADIEKAVFSLPVGGVSDPIRAADGYRIFRVSEKTEAGMLDFETAKLEIKNRLEMERFTKEYDTHLAELRKNAVIDIRVREVPLQIDETGRLVEVPILPGAGGPSRLSIGGAAGEDPPTRRTPTASEPATAPSSDDDEISTSGSAKPETVNPAAPPN